MSRPYRIAIATCVLVVLCACAVGPTLAQELINPYEYADRSPTAVYEEDRNISGHQGQSETLAFRLTLFGAPGKAMPLLVQVHEWGGDFQRQEDIARLAPAEYSFVMLSFQYRPSSNNEDDWWLGTQWDGRLRFWAAEAVMAIVREALESDLIPKALNGVTIDPERVYLFGHSIGGTGAWQIGLRYGHVFAAIHAHAGFARYTGPVGPFTEQFQNDLVGAEGQGVVFQDDQGREYPARDFTNLAWWLTQYKNPAHELPFVFFTAGTTDDAVVIESGGDLMLPVLEEQKRGFMYCRHSGEHSDAVFVQLNWVWNMRRDQSFPALTNRSYGQGPNDAAPPWEWRAINDLREYAWDPETIVDEPDRYEITLTGQGTADVTPRRLQRFKVEPGASYRYWFNEQTGPGEKVVADEWGLVTIPHVEGGTRLIIQPESLWQ